MTCLVRMNHFEFCYATLGHLDGYIMSYFIMSQPMTDSIWHSRTTTCNLPKRESL